MKMVLIGGIGAGEWSVGVLECWSLGVLEFWSNVVLGWPQWQSLLHYSITPLLQHSITPSLHYSSTPLLQHSITPALHSSNTPSLQHSITPSLHHSITPSLHHSITPSLHHSITPSLHYSSTPAPPPPPSLNPRDDVQNLSQHVQRRVRRVDGMNDLRSIEVEHRPRFCVVGFQALADNLEVRVVETVLAKRAALQALDHLARVGARKVEHGLHVERVGQHPGLADVARDAVEHERVPRGIELAVGRAGFDVFGPQRDGRFVGHQFAFARVVNEHAADGIFDAQIAKRVAAGEVEKAGDRADDLSLGALAGARRAEEEDRAVFHGGRIG